MIYEDGLNRTLPTDASLDDLKSELLDTTIGRNKPQIKKENEEALKNIEELNKLVKDVNDEFKAAEKIIDKLNKTTKRLDDSFDDTIKALQKAAGSGTFGGGAGGGSGSGGGGGRGGSGFGRSDGEGGDFFSNAADAHAAQAALATFRGSVTQTFNSLSKKLLDGRSIFDTAFGGTVETAIDFNIELRKAAFEVAGIGAEARSAQREWARLDNAVAETGSTYQEVQTNYIEALRSGVQDQKDAFDITKSSLNAAEMIGDRTGNTSRIFQEWYKSLRMSNAQLSETSRNMQQVGRETGVVGDALVHAVQASEQFMINMRNTGQLTAEAARGMMMIVTEARKLGVETAISPILELLTDPSKLIAGGGGVRNLLLMAAGARGVTGAALDGTITQTRSGRRELALGYEDVFGRLSGGRTIAEFDATATDAEKRRMDIILSQFDTSFGELRGTIEALSQGSQSLTEQLRELGEQANNANLTMEERAAAEKKYQDAITTSGLGVATAFEEQRKKLGSASINEIAAAAAARFDQDRLEDINTLAKEMGVSIATDTDKFRVSMLAAAKSISDAGGEDLTGAVQKAFASGDARQVQSVTDALNAAQREVAVDDKASIDPALRMQQDVSEIAEILRGTLSPILRGIMDFVGYGGIMAIHLGAIVTGMWSIASALAGMGGISSLLDKLIALFTGRSVLAAGGSAVSAMGAATDIAGVGAGAGAARGLGGASRTATVVSGAVGSMADTVSGVSGSLSKLTLSSAAIGPMALAAVKPIMIGAAALLVLAPAVTALAMAIVKMGEFASSMISPDEAAAAAEGLGAIIWAAAKIAGAVVLGAAGLSVMPLLAPLYTPMLLGAATLGQLAVPAMLMSAAVIKMTQGFTNWVVDPDQAVKAAEGLSVVLGAGASIAWSVVKMSGMMTAFGLLAAISGPLVALMAVGASTLGMLAAPSLLLAAAVTTLARGFTSIIDPDKAAKAAEGLASVLSATASIAWSIVKMSGMMTAFGLLATISGPLVVLMAVGASTLGMLASPALLLAAAVTTLARGFTSIIDPDKAAKAAEGLASVLSATASIAWSVVKMAGALSILGLLSTVGVGLVPLMGVGAATLGMMTMPALLLSAVIIEMTKKLTSLVVDPKEAGKAAEGLAGVLGAASSIAWSVVKMTAALSILGVLLPFAPLLAMTMTAGAVALGMLTTPVMLLSTAIVGMSTLFTGLVGGLEATESAKAFSEFLVATRSIIWSVLKMSAVLTSLALLVPFAGVAAAAMSVGAGALTQLAGPVSAISLAIVAITNKVMESVDLPTVLKSTRDVGILLDAVANTVDILKIKIVPLTESGWFSSSPIKRIAEGTKTFSDVFGSIATFITRGIVRPLSAIPTDALAEAVTTAQMISDLIDKVVSITSKMDVVDQEGLAGISTNVKGMIDALEPLEGWDQQPVTISRHRNLSVETQGAVQPVPIMDIEDQINRRRASGGGGPSEALVGIQAANDRQVQLLERVADGIDRLNAMLSPGGKETAEVSTRMNRRPRHSADYGAWKYGKPGTQSNRNIINDGIA